MVPTAIYGGYPTTAYLAGYGPVIVEHGCMRAGGGDYVVLVLYQHGTSIIQALYHKIGYYVLSYISPS